MRERRGGAGGVCEEAVRVPREPGSSTVEVVPPRLDVHVGVCWDGEGREGGQGGGGQSGTKFLVDIRRRVDEVAATIPALSGEDAAYAQAMLDKLPVYGFYQRKGK